MNIARMGRGVNWNWSGAGLLSVVLLAGGCGGGGGGDTGSSAGSGSTGSSSGSSTPAPGATPVQQSSVTLQASAATISSDQRVTLSWASSNATACTATGAWSGSLAAQGEQTLLMTSLGESVFGISCTGTAGAVTGSAGVTVSADPAKQVIVANALTLRTADIITGYPAIFQAAPATLTANDPYCGIVIPAVVVPASHIGNLPLPAPAGRLPATAMRGIGLKDYYPRNPSGGNGCLLGEDAAHAAYIATLDRVARLGADHIWVYNYARWKDLTQPVWDIDTNDLQISDAEMTWLVAEAAKRNLKVYLEWQLNPSDMQGNSLPQATTQAQLERLLTSYRGVILGRAAAANRSGITMMNADWTAFYIPNLNDFRPTFVAGMLSVLQGLRQTFQGKIMFGFQRIVDPVLLPYMDYLRVEVDVPRITSAENANLSVAMLKAKYLQQIDNLADNQLPTSVPVIWYPLVQSKRDFFVTGWVEDGFCLNSCEQRGFVTDYSVQAVGMEAVFQAVAAQTRFKTGGFALNTSYWLADNMLPSPGDASVQTSFPNLSQSIRNKPAEAIVKQWFAR